MESEKNKHESELSCIYLDIDLNMCKNQLLWIDKNDKSQGKYIQKTIIQKNKSSNLFQFHVYNIPLYGFFNFPCLTIWQDTYGKDSTLVRSIYEKTLIWGKPLSSIDERISIYIDKNDNDNLFYICRLDLLHTNSTRMASIREYVYKEIARIKNMNIYKIPRIRFREIVIQNQDSSNSQNPYKNYKIYFAPKKNQNSNITIWKKTIKK